MDGELRKREAGVMGGLHGAWTFRVGKRSEINEEWEWVG